MKNDQGNPMSHDKNCLALCVRFVKIYRWFIYEDIILLRLSTFFFYIWKNLLSSDLS